MLNRTFFITCIAFITLFFHTNTHANSSSLTFIKPSPDTSLILILSHKYDLFGGANKIDISLDSYPYTSVSSREIVAFKTLPGKHRVGIKKSRTFANKDYIDINCRPGKYYFINTENDTTTYSVSPRLIDASQARNLALNYKLKHFHSEAFETLSSMKINVRIDESNVNKLFPDLPEDAGSPSDRNVLRSNFFENYSPPPDKALVFVFNETYEYSIGSENIDITLDDNPSIPIKKWQSIIYETSAGKHKIAIQRVTDDPTKQYVELDCAKGGYYFVSTGISQGSNYDPSTPSQVATGRGREIAVKQTLRYFAYMEDDKQEVLKVNQPFNSTDIELFIRDTSHLDKSSVQSLFSGISPAPDKALVFVFGQNIPFGDLHVETTAQLDNGVARALNKNEIISFEVEAGRHKLALNQPSRYQDSKYIYFNCKKGKKYFIKASDPADEDMENPEPIQLFENQAKKIADNYSISSLKD